MGGGTARGRRARHLVLLRPLALQHARLAPSGPCELIKYVPPKRRWRISDLTAKPSRGNRFRGGGEIVGFFPFCKVGVCRQNEEYFRFGCLGRDSGLLFLRLSTFIVHFLSQGDRFQVAPPPTLSPDAVQIRHFSFDLSSGAGWATPLAPSWTIIPRRKSSLTQ